MVMALVGLMTLASACQREDFLLPQLNDAPDGYVTIEFMAQVPDMNQVKTKAVDPDGGGVQQLTVFCFDENDLFITTVTAKLDKSMAGTQSLSGKLEVTVPEHAHTLQIVGNQNLTYFTEDKYRGMSEVEVMSSLEASAGRMIYWGRSTVESLKKDHQTEATALMLLRNQAKITLNVQETSGFEQKGWVVVNSSAFGTVAPYCVEHGFEAPHYIDRPFVTLPQNKSKLGDYLDVRTNEEEYIFETSNTADDPIDFIVKGSQDKGEDLYYRISIMDDSGEYIRILRNHHYQINISGALEYGQKTFAEALEAPATNNVWISISDDINVLTDGTLTLRVDQTSVVIAEDEFEIPNEYWLHYTLTTADASPLTAAEVSWQEGNNVAKPNFIHTFDPSTGRGSICVELQPMGGMSKREGTLLIKSGVLSRKIKVVTLKQQKFEPAWITTNVYGLNTGEHITMMFTIPDECPDELFPMDVLISVNDIDIRNESGMILPVITPEDERYGEDNGIGYKYLLHVEGAGKQRVYLQTINNHLQGDQVELTIEARCFESLTKIATFQSEVNQWIMLHGLGTYSAQYPADEVIYYYLVPQKINAPVVFPSHFAQMYYNLEDAKAQGYSQGNSGWEIIDYREHGINDLYYAKQVTPSPNDEFLIYSRYLSFDTDGSVANDFDFYPVNESEWGTGGRVFGFARSSTFDEVQGGVYRMHTNSPRSTEVVRIASNPKGSPSITGTGVSDGEQYRSAIFELANYHPFRFAAQINGEGTIQEGSGEEVIDDVTFAYRPDQQVNIDFDVTSFAHSDGKSSVDPFGTAFDIYIDAPMLELDKTSPLYDSQKMTADPDVPGRFIYHVDASREVERTYGNASLTPVVDVLAENQEGERKRIPFRTKRIVSAGDITISSDEAKVVYYQKRFRIHNNSIVGRLQYQTPEGPVDVPAGSFVPFEVEPTYNRIGTVSISSGGSFELRLRSEYDYDWDTDDVKLQFTLDGKVYEKTFTSLSALESVLSEPIVLD